MNEILSGLTEIKGYGGYSTTIVLLFLWWKGLPQVLEAWSNRQSKIEERMGKLLEDAQVRFAGQIREADSRHEKCIEGQEMLRLRVAELEGTIDRMRTQMTQIGISTYREATGRDELSPPMDAMLSRLGAVPRDTPDDMTDTLGKMK